MPKLSGDLALCGCPGACCRALFLALPAPHFPWKMCQALVLAVSTGRLPRTSLVRCVYLLSGVVSGLFHCSCAPMCLAKPELLGWIPPAGPVQGTDPQLSSVHGGVYWEALAGLCWSHRAVPGDPEPRRGIAMGLEPQS